MQIKFIGDTHYGGWNVVIDNLDDNSVVYSFGAGDNISWDLELIRTFNCQIYAYDPDPMSIEWLKTQSLPERFVFRPIGLAARNGTQRFYDPLKKGKVSASTIKKNRTFKDLPVKKLTALMRENGHSHIDLLKMDIEGSEFSVLPTIAALPIDQILVEIHTNFYRYGLKGIRRIWGGFRTWYAILRLRTAGFVCVKQVNEDYTFLKRNMLRENS